MPNDTLTITDNRTGRQYDVPVSDDTIRAMDLDGNIFEREATELLARAFQHEIDHLHGKLFIDYLSFLKRRGVMARWEDMKDKYPSQRRVLTAPVNAGAEQASGDENG